MTFNAYFATVSLGTLVCIFALSSIIFNIDPEEAGLIGFLMFYATFFLGVVGLCSSIGLLIRKLLFGDENLVFRHIKRTFRQSVIFGGLCVSILLLLQYNYLRWWNAIILLSLGIVLEGMVYTNRKYSNQDYVR